MVFKHGVTLACLLVAFAIMVKLGFWQLQRLEWKEGLLADIEVQEAVNPMDAPLNLNNPPNFATGYIDGTFNDNIVSVSPRTREGEVGSDVYTVIRTADNTHIAVNLGWVPNGEAPIFADLYPGRFAGYLREPDDPNGFTPDNAPESNQWYAYEEESFKTYYNVDDIYDKVLYLTHPLPSSNIKAFEGLPRPRNKHAQYAAFWFGMAGLLVILTGLFIWRSRKH